MAFLHGFIYCLFLILMVYSIVCLVSFHHRNGPQLDSCFPPFPAITTFAPPSKHTRIRSDSSSQSEGDVLSVGLPIEWSFMPFSCLPDGAHASQQEFIYFHLPPVSDWKDECSGNYRKTVFGLSCYRQIAADELLIKTSDVTRSTVQKSVVVLASEPFLGSIRSKLGMVTEAFFAQKDFSKTEILQHLYESLNTSFPVPLSDSTMFMGASLRELVYKFRQRTLPLFKLLLLGKRILFFGQKVERLTCYQYSLISLIPHLIRNISSSAANTLDLPTIYPQTSTNISDPYNAKIKRFNLPLKIFGKGAVWLPYIPLQQIDVLLSTDTKSFVIGSSNAIFMNHSACDIDAVVNTDAGTLEFRDPYLSSLLSLTSADKRFIEEIVKTVIFTWTDNEGTEIDNTNIPQIEFEGSDDDIRSRFEMYLLSLLVSVKAMKEQQPKTKDFFSDYNTQYIKALQSSPAFSEWERTTSTQALKEGIPNGGFAVNPGHPYSGTSAISAMQLSITSKLSELTRSVSSAKVMSDAESSLKGVVDVVTDPASHAKVQASANQFFSSVCSWYSQKKAEWISNPTVGQNESESESASPIDQYVMLPDGEAAKDNGNDK